jgi:hypothetical protein
MLLFPVLAGTIPKYRVLPHWFGIAASHEAVKFASDSAIPSAAGITALTAPFADIRLISTRPATPRATDGPEAAKPLSKPSTPIRMGQFASSASLLFVAWSIGAGYVLLRLALGRLWLSGVANSAVRLQTGPIAEDVLEACRRLGVGRRVEFFLTPRRDAHDVGSTSQTGAAAGRSGRLAATEIASRAAARTGAPQTPRHRHPRVGGDRPRRVLVPSLCVAGRLKIFPIGEICEICGKKHSFALQPGYARRWRDLKSFRQLVSLLIVPALLSRKSFRLSIVDLQELLEHGRVGLVADRHGVAVGKRHKRDALVSA